MHSVDRRVLLSGLWLFVILNIIFRDIHELVTAKAIKEILSGTMNGTPVTDELMLVGAFLVEIPILMVLLARVLPPSPNRWLNIIVAPVVLAGTVINPPRDSDDIFFLIVQFLALVVIILVGWTWSQKSYLHDAR